MERSEVEAIVDLLASKGEAEIESFFLAHGLQDAFNSPGKGWGKRKKLNAALAKAGKRGDLDEVLRAAVGKFARSRGQEVEPWLERSSESKTESPVDARLLSLHPDVRSASSELFLNRHMAEAIFAAFRAVESRVRGLSRSTEYGRSLMASAFNENDPTLRLNPLESASDRDEQEGFRFLFMGAIQGIRNPKAHDDVVQEDPERSLDYLGFASLLMRRLDDAERLLEDLEE